MKLKRSLILLCTAVIIFGLLGCQTLRPAQYSVKRISDGDTITVTDTTGTDIKVRFACVDAPEVAHSTKERYSKKQRYVTNLSGVFKLRSGLSS